ncbi:hepatitis A virus cellular receptor 1 isoform X2 [Carassius gibelio]|uniref:hepatitis A virus cellular receptor 1 isoform X2 n=1 Tax=Carassius gibelio TaxID=101364 RepID=UPI002279AD3B|nr:hepatitis A virus cellular receptor 1 isoform X2 [Carassius gibelio]
MRRMKIFWTFTLLMIPGVLSSISVRGYSGGEVNITCRYDREYTEKNKYFCRGEWKITCSELIKTDKENKWVDSGRFSLFDDTTAAVFTVTFRDLSERDSGTYWCGVKKRGPDPYTEVNLIVESGSSLIIGVSVTLLLLIIGLVSFIVALCKKHQARDKDPESDSKRSAPGTEKSEEVPEMPYIYEDIKDTRPQTDYKTAPLPTNPSDSTKTVYATTQLPTNPSDSTKTVYATTQLPTNPSDSTKTVYVTTQLPTNPSDSTKTIYATPQLPTNPSDSTKTVYATPQLPTNPSDST